MKKLRMMRRDPSHSSAKIYVDVLGHASVFHAPEDDVRHHVHINHDTAFELLEFFNPSTLPAMFRAYVEPYVHDSPVNITVFDSYVKIRSRTPFYRYYFISYLNRYNLIVTERMRKEYTMLVDRNVMSTIK